MRKLNRPRSTRQKKVVCTVSAAALMLGVSSAATVGLNFQDSYCNGSGDPAAGYSGFPVTMTAFGIPPANWESLTEMGTGYSGCVGVVGYTLAETIDTTTSTNGLNPLPNGSLSVNWFGPTANFSNFGGYVAGGPHYNYGGPCPQASGEEQVYAGFIRDGINFGPSDTSGDGGSDNHQPGYSIDVTGLKSVFTNSSFVVELIAASDSMQLLTNAYVVDVPGLITNSVSYPNTPPVADAGSADWVRGQGGGLSTVSAALNTDHIQIFSAHPAHGGTGTPPTGFDNAGTISGFIITDKPVFTMKAQQVASLLGDTITLNPYVIGVPPMSLQWRLNGVPIAGQTAMSITVTNVGAANAGNYDLVASNAYGTATSGAIRVGDLLQQVPATGIVLDSNTANTPNNGHNMGATWEASDTDGTTTRTGVMSFNAAVTNGISVDDSGGIDETNGSTVTFWMRTSGDASADNNAAIVVRPNGNNNGKEFSLTLAPGAPGNLQYEDPNGLADEFVSVAGVADDKWHFIALTVYPSIESGASFVGLYIDGSLDSTQGDNTAFTWSTGMPLEIGYSSDPTYTNYSGLLDDVRFYSAVLSPSQITQVKSGSVADAADLQLQFNFTAAPGSGLTLSWQSGGAVLQSAPSVTGPWTDLPGASSPFTIVPGPASQYFRYHVSHTPQTLVSNPYLM